MKKCLLRLVFLVALNSLIAPKVDAALIGSWNFNEGLGDVANDSSGFGNNATGLDSGWVSGKYGYGTVSNNIIVPPDPSLFTSSSVSITAWAKIDEFNVLHKKIL